jgi:hypothetical protein
MKLRFWCPSRNEFVTDVRCWASCVGNLYFIGFREEEVIPQLFTGCYDKNKKEIFEGDKINYGGSIGTVEFFAGKFQLDWGDQTDDDLAYLMINNMEVVGNIFEGVTKLLDVVEKEENDEEDLNLDKCEQCGEPAWDGYICHVCGMKHI